MKYFTKLCLVMFAFCACAVVQAQEVDRIIKIKIKKEINGEMTTIEKTYKNIDEMKSDPDLEHLNLKIMNGGTFFFSDDSNEKFDITIDKDEEVHENHFFFKADGDKDFEWKTGSNEIEVTRDEDGNVTILRDGRPIDQDENLTIHKFNSDDISSVEHIKIHKGDDGRKIIVVNGGKEIGWDAIEEEEIQEKVEVIVNSLRDFKDGEDQKISTVKISVRKIKIHIEDLTKTDESLKNLNLDNRRELKLNDLAYYPNPTEGKFNLSFQGKSLPTEIRITDLSGKTVFSDVMSDFSGQYNNDIDLNNEAKGVYIMQIIQGNKALNKKIIIE